MDKQDGGFVRFHCLQGRVFPQGDLCQTAAPEADHGHENATWGMVFVGNCPGNNVIGRGKRTVGDNAFYLCWQWFAGSHDDGTCPKGKSAEKDLMFCSKTFCYIINPLPAVFSFIDSKRNIFSFASATASLVYDQQVVSKIIVMVCIRTEITVSKRPIAVKQEDGSFCGRIGDQVSVEFQSVKRGNADFFIWLSCDPADAIRDLFIIFFPGSSFDTVGII